MVVTNGYFKYENGKLKIIPGPIPFADGPDGPQGPDGDTGPQGPDGDTGPTGDAGSGGGIVTNGLLMNLDAATYSGSGTTWTDSTSNGNNATLVNGTTWNSNGWFSSDGSHCIATAGDNGFASGDSDRSCSVWVNYADDSTSFLMQYGAIVEQQAVFFGRAGATDPNAGIHVDGINAAVFVPSYFPQAGSWTMLTFAYQAGNMKVYSGTNVIYNGSFNTGAHSSFNTVLTGTTIIGGAVDTTTAAINGSIGQVMMYNRALSDAEVTQNFNATKARYGL